MPLVRKLIAAVMLGAVMVAGGGIVADAHKGATGGRANTAYEAAVKVGGTCSGCHKHDRIEKK